MSTNEPASNIETETPHEQHTPISAVEALRPINDVEQQDTETRKPLRQVWQEGVDSGDLGEVDFVALKQEARARLAALEP